jgi:hypothetical protein
MKAFPTTKPLDLWDAPNQGIDLRDYFASQAMNSYLDGNDAPIDFYLIAQRAYQMADAMMKAREQ